MSTKNCLPVVVTIFTIALAVNFAHAQSGIHVSGDTVDIGTGIHVDSNEVRIGGSGSGATKSESQNYRRETTREVVRKYSTQDAHTSTVQRSASSHTAVKKTVKAAASTAQTSTAKISTAKTQSGAKANIQVSAKTAEKTVTQAVSKDSSIRNNNRARLETRTAKREGIHADSDEVSIGDGIRVDDRDVQIGDGIEVSGDEVHIGGIHIDSGGVSIGE